MSSDVNQCRDCCCARTWRALGLEGIPNPKPLHAVYDHVADLKSDRDTLAAQVERVKALVASLYDQQEIKVSRIHAALAAPSVGDVEVAHPTNCECPRCARPGPSPVGGTCPVCDVCGVRPARKVTGKFTEAWIECEPCAKGATGEAGYAGPERRVLRAPATAYLEFIGYVYARGPQRSLHANTRAAKEGGK